MKKIFIALVLIAAVIYGGAKIFTNNTDQLAQASTASQRVISGTVLPLSVVAGSNINITLAFAQPYNTATFPLAAELLGFEPFPMIRTGASGNTVRFTARVPANVTPGQYEFSAINTSNRTVAWVLGDGATMVRVTAPGSAAVVTTPTDNVNSAGLTLTAEEISAPTFTRVPNYNTTTYYKVSWAEFPGGIKCDRVITSGVQMYSVSSTGLQMIPAAGFTATARMGNQIFAFYSDSAKQVTLKCASVSNRQLQKEVLFNIRAAVVPAAPVITSITPPVISRKDTVGKNFILQGSFPSNPNNPHPDSWLDYSIITESSPVSQTHRVRFVSSGSWIPSAQLNATNKNPASFRIMTRKILTSPSQGPSLVSNREMPVGTYRIKLQNMKYPHLVSNTVTVTVTE